MDSLPGSHPKTSIAYIGLGSNVGDREQHLRSSLAALRQIGDVANVSSFYETEPVGTVVQPEFLNAVAELRTVLPPEELLRVLLGIEQQHGRNRDTQPPKGPRTLDLDLLAYNNLVMDTPSLTLPHPALAQRMFVLVPLAEIASKWRHPIGGKTASHLLKELQNEPVPSGSDRIPAVRKFHASRQSS